MRAELGLPETLTPEDIANANIGGGNDQLGTNWSLGYWESFHPKIQEMRMMPYAERREHAKALVAFGYPIDEVIHIYGGHPLANMFTRVMEGITIPGLVVSIHPKDFPPYQPPNAATGPSPIGERIAAAEWYEEGMPLDGIGSRWASSKTDLYSPGAVYKDTQGWIFRKILWENRFKQWRRIE